MSKQGGFLGKSCPKKAYFPELQFCQARYKIIQTFVFVLESCSLRLWFCRPQSK